MRLYLDANAIIYCVEGVPEFRSAALGWVERARQVEGSVILTSRFSRLECLSKPMSEGDPVKLASFVGFFDTLRLVSITDELLEQAVALRARYRLRSADALHLATSIAEGADVFLTSDRRLARCTEVQVALIP